MANVSLLATIADSTASQLSGTISAIMPTGTVLPFAGSTAPSGWLLCDGTAYSRTTYSQLFSVISTTYGIGDNSTTFNVPNCQGIFIAGSGSQVISGVTYTRTHGNKQGDVVQGHKHSNSISTYSTNVQSATGRISIGSGPVSGSSTPDNFFLTVDGPTTDGTNGTPRTGAETRPANIAMNYIIKV